MEAAKIYDEALQLWGAEAVVAVALCEAAELTAAIIQHDLQGRDYLSVMEKVVDVSIMSEQLGLICSPAAALLLPGGATPTLLLTKAMSIFAQPSLSNLASIQEALRSLLSACDILWPDRESTEEFQQMKEGKLGRLYEKVCAEINRQAMGAVEQSTTSKNHSGVASVENLNPLPLQLQKTGA
ncbi:MULTISPECIES: hypothetical protein [Cyanophyceae]|uniref:hypothetical protein n=1 Tax=Cyanophyceae TaxID=3028117 RepID=UPI0016837404|nr:MULTISPECIES: hypothetical protein [Cyanophyceae]MBD1917282.1 hypothetical protein [Phormidium sp. FACHB-77]MBD2028498.1 hypothetical protein [Phormidium sp. FACHB-322]MBD2049679.1 hypothetical protein [Leptolyngbya sp. FACHB-60]